jgi:hypothetical protein
MDEVEGRREVARGWMKATLIPECKWEEKVQVDQGGKREGGLI